MLFNRNMGLLKKCIELLKKKVKFNKIKNCKLNLKNNKLENKIKIKFKMIRNLILNMIQILMSILIINIFDNNIIKKKYIYIFNNIV